MKNERMIILNHDNFSNSQRGKKYWNSSDFDLILVSQDFLRNQSKFTLFGISSVLTFLQIQTMKTF